MRLFVGLGNPGTKYQGNRHNIGFIALDVMARRHGFAPWRRRFQGETSEGTLDGERVVLLKPTTYMNESGRAARYASRSAEASRDTTVCARSPHMRAMIIAGCGWVSGTPA